MASTSNGTPVVASGSIDSLVNNPKAGNEAFFNLPMSVTTDFPTTTTNPSTKVVKEGWLYKRGKDVYDIYISAIIIFVTQGEHIRNWRPRYFILYDDGSFRGFKRQPDSAVLRDQLNNFTVKGCQILKTDALGKENAFILRGLQWTSVIERTFHTETAEEREQWCTTIAAVAAQLDPKQSRPPNYIPGFDNNEDIEMVDASNNGSSRLHISSYDSGRGPRIQLDDFEFLKVLGKGTFGKVILCREKKTAQLFAIKVLKKETIIAKDEVAHTLTENRVLRHTKHPFLIVSISAVSDVYSNGFPCSSAPTVITILFPNRRPSVFCNGICERWRAVLSSLTRSHLQRASNTVLCLPDITRDRIPARPWHHLP